MIVVAGRVEICRCGFHQGNVCPASICLMFLLTIAFTVLFPNVVLYLPKLLSPESVGCFKNPSGSGSICPP
jgi:C4-dicarboxylate transporter DctM subunit